MYSPVSRADCCVCKGVSVALLAVVIGWVLELGMEVVVVLVSSASLSF